MSIPSATRLTERGSWHQDRLVRSKLLAAAFVIVLGLVALYFGAPSTVRGPLIAANRASAGLEARVTRIDGHELHFLERDGRGEETIVLLHGIFAVKDHGVDFARALDGEPRVLVPDLPGFGESTRRDDARYDYASQVERLHAFLVDRGVGDVHLAGSSMGGTIAALYAIAHPERVRSVAFVGAPLFVMWGARDRIFDASGAEPLRTSRPDARIELLEGLGHLPMMEDPSGTATRYRDFLDSL